MDLLELKASIKKRFSGSKADWELLDSEFERSLKLEGKYMDERILFPFNIYEGLLFNCLKKRVLGFDQYEEIRDEYYKENPYLALFQISSPRGFGEGFAHEYLIGRCPKLEKATKKIDPNYDNEYDLRLDNIKIEVKASRAVDSKSDDPLYMKALPRETNRPFFMNFQQLKPQCCDVFIWVAVFRDEIIIWVMSSKEIYFHDNYNDKQHRGGKNEGQLHIKNDNIDILKKYLIKENDLEQKIRNAARRQKRQPDICEKHPDRKKYSEL